MATAGAARCGVFAINALLMVLGCVIVGFASVVVRAKGTANWTPILAIVLGAGIIALALLAVCGVLTKARTCLSFYLWALLPLTVIQLVIGILAIVRSEQIARVVDEKSQEYDIQGGTVQGWILNNIRRPDPRPRHPGLRPRTYPQLELTRAVDAGDRAAGIILLLVNAAVVMYISGAISAERARHDTVTLAIPDSPGRRRAGRSRPPAVQALRDKYGFGAGSGGGEVAV
eukprot:tig00021720_g23190.t1